MRLLKLALNLFRKKRSIEEALFDAQELVQKAHGYPDHMVDLKTGKVIIENGKPTPFAYDWYEQNFKNEVLEPPPIKKPK